MKLLVNAISTREGGALTVLEKLLEGMLSADLSLQITAVVHPAAARTMRPVQRLKLVTEDGADRSARHLFGFYNATLPGLAAGHDALFSMTNYLPLRPIDCPEILLLQHAGHFSAEFDHLLRSRSGIPAVAAWRLKRHWVRRSIKHARQLLVQSHALAEAVEKELGPASPPIGVVAHGPGLVTHVAKPRTGPARTPLRVGYITKHGIQKDVATVLKACQMLKQGGMDVRLVLTLNAKDHAFDDLNRRVSDLTPTGLVENHGDLPRENIQTLYDTLDVFAFASTVESFGFPMVEAMARALPLAVADVAISREIAGSAGLYFPPHSPDALAAKIAEVAQHPNHYAQHSAASLEQSKRFTWQTAARETLDLIKRAVSQKPAATFGG